MAESSRADHGQKRDSQKVQTVVGYAPSSAAVAADIAALAKQLGRSEQETVQWLLDTSPAKVPLVEQGGLGRSLAGVLSNRPANS